jgi:UDP-glucose 4-epimerase
MDLVHVRDVASANVAALAFCVSDRAINIGNNEEVSLYSLLKTLLKVNHSQSVPLHLAANKVNPVTRRLADNTLARDLLKFSPSMTIEEGMRELSTWYYEKQKNQIEIL